LSFYVRKDSLLPPENPASPSRQEQRSTLARTQFAQVSNRCLPRRARGAAAGLQCEPARAARGWLPSQEALAEAADLHRTHVGFLEQGRREPSLSTLLILADALGVSVERLARGSSGAEGAQAAAAGERRSAVTEPRSTGQ
jgi:DNA-binding XRE family transcriptional regulator